MLRSVVHRRSPSTLHAGAISRRLLCSRAPIGMGYISEEIADVSRAFLIREMMAAIDLPGRHMPGVTSVMVQPATDREAADEGALWRRMTIGGKTIVEHIYANPARGEIRRVPLEDSGMEAEHEVVNRLTTKPLRIEYFLRDRQTQERLHSDEPAAFAALAIGQTIKLARAKEEQANDACHFGAKA